MTQKDQIEVLKAALIEIIQLDTSSACVVLIATAALTEIAQ